MPKANVILVTEAAKEKGCTAQALKNAVIRGDLNAVRQGRYWLIVRDEQYDAYEVQQTGGRLHQRYLDKKEEE